MAPAPNPDPGSMDVAGTISAINDFWALIAAGIGAIIFLLKFIWNFSSYIRGINERFNSLEREIQNLRADARAEIKGLRDWIQEHRP